MSYSSSDSDSDIPCPSLSDSLHLGDFSVPVYLIDSGAKPKIHPDDGIYFSPKNYIDYMVLKLKVEKHFPIIRGKKYYMTFIDEHGFSRTVYNDKDLEATDKLCNNSQLYVVYNNDIDESCGKSYPTQYFCNHCCSALRHIRFRCKKCQWYDLCEDCLNDGVHRNHDFKRKSILNHVRSNSKEIKQISYYDLRIKRKIGEGYFGKVYTAKCLSLHKQVAVKFFKDPRGKENNFLKELKVLDELGGHENIVHIFGFVYGDLMGVIMEHVSIEVNGRQISGLSTYFMHLRDLLKSGKYVEHRELDSFALQIARGMEHLENKKILHRDLATRNILIDGRKNVKISDFGTSRLDDYYESDHMFAVRWAAPEVLKFNSYSHKSDVWAFGIVLWEIGSLGGMPYGDLSTNEVRKFVQNNGRMRRPKNVAGRLYRIMESCWAKVPQERPNFNALVEKLIDFKWMEPAYYGFDSVTWGEDLPDAVEVYQHRYEGIHY